MRADIFVLGKICDVLFTNIYFSHSGKFEHVKRSTSVLANICTANESENYSGFEW